MNTSNYSVSIQCDSDHWFWLDEATDVRLPELRSLPLYTITMKKPKGLKSRIINPGFPKGIPTVSGLPWKTSEFHQFRRFLEEHTGYASELFGINWPSVLSDRRAEVIALNEAVLTYPPDTLTNHPDILSKLKAEPDKRAYIYLANASRTEMKYNLEVIYRGNGAFYAFGDDLIKLREELWEAFLMLNL